jgi:hypothetical protein
MFLNAILVDSFQSLPLAPFSALSHVTRFSTKNINKGNKQHIASFLRYLGNVSGINNELHP